MSTSTQPDPTADEKPPIQLEVKVESPEACKREIVVTVPKAEVERYFREAYDELVPEASVPGFRSGRAPRKLVEKQFRDRVTDQVKGSLLMDCLSQVTDTDEFSAISEPDFDFESIEDPGDSDFKFQFTIEVRPEFATPEWHGLELNRPVEVIDDDEIDRAIGRALDRYATLEPTDEPAEPGDQLLITAEFRDGDKLLSGMDEERVTLASELSLSDATIDDFGSVMKGVREGETREAKAKVSEGHADEAYRGKEVDASIHVVEVLTRETPPLTPALLEELGDFKSEQELREFVRDSLVRQADYRTQQKVRERVVELLAGSADFDLPADLVRRQTTRELDRKVLELRRSGFDEESVRRYVNLLRQNAQTTTESALREHFILEQIAEEEKIDATPADYEDEIRLIARQSDMPERRVRARLEKSGQMDALRNQIVERKMIEKIIEAANITDTPIDKQANEEEKAFAVYHQVVGGKDPESIPQAQYDDTTLPGGKREPEQD